LAENSKIEWTDHTFNPWRGCTKVSDGCKNCYAETMSGRNPRMLGVWGPKGTRVIASENYWKQPLRWNREAKEAGVRRRVFCASLADVFEGQDTMPAECWEAVQKARERLFGLAYETKWLDWLFLTKRPENIPTILSSVKHLSYPHTDWWTLINRQPRYNWWFGTSVENQECADERIPHLLRCPAEVRFLSVEPLLGPLDLMEYLTVPCPSCDGAGGGRNFHTLSLDDGAWDCQQCEGSGRKIEKYMSNIDWVIIGGESGTGARPFDIQWARSIITQCRAAGVAVFMKQVGSQPMGSALDCLNGWISKLDRKGGDWQHWPQDLRVREMPAEQRT
jgi:protein gp37